MSNDRMKAELAALKAKRKPAPTPEQAKAIEEERALLAEIASEMRALREEENEDIVARYAPTKRRRFFDFDPDNECPATVEHDGSTCALYTRFVVRGATADQLERNSDAITVRGLDASGKPDVAIDTKVTSAVMTECAETCIVYPTPETAGVSPEQHVKNIKVSLLYLGAARAEVGQAALQLGGIDAAARRSKS